MYGMSYKAGSVVLQQGALPKPDDCMYYLQSGETDVVISGAVDSKAQAGEERKIEGHTVRIPQRPGWVFGDVALLFHSPRTASVMARTNITVWALDRKTFLQFVMKHAQVRRAAAQGVEKGGDRPWGGEGGLVALAASSIEYPRTA
jgi:CRP-like cAMP-binding protein